MLLRIYNLPSNTQYQDIKTLIKDKCGVSEVLVDNLQYEGKTKKVTVGLMNEDDAAIVVRKVHGIYINGQQLYVEVLRKGKSSEQPYKPSSPSVAFQQQTQYQQPPPYYSYNNTFVPTMMNQPGTSQMSSYQLGYMPMPVPKPTDQTIPMEYINPGGMLMGSQMMPPTQQGHQRNFQYGSDESQNWRHGGNSTENMGRNTSTDNLKRNYNSDRVQWNTNGQNQKSNWQTLNESRVFKRAFSPTNSNSKEGWRDECPEWQSNRSAVNAKSDTAQNKRQRTDRPIWEYNDLEDNNDVKRYYESSSDMSRNRDLFWDKEKNKPLTNNSSRDRKRHSSPTHCQYFSDLSNKKQKKWDTVSGEPNRGAGLYNPPRSRDSPFKNFQQNPGASDYHGENYKRNFETNFISQNHPKKVFDKNLDSVRSGFTADQRKSNSQVTGGRSERWVEKRHETFNNTKSFRSNNTQNNNKSKNSPPPMRHVAFGNKWDDTRKSIDAKTKPYSSVNQYNETRIVQSNKKKTANFLLQKQESWIGHAATIILKNLVKKFPEYTVKKHQLKAKIRSRIEIVLGNEVGMQPHKIIQLYREKFNKDTDELLYTEIKQENKATFSNNEGWTKEKTSNNSGVTVKTESQQNVDLRGDTEIPANPVPKRVKIPKYPNSDKNQFKQQKRQAYQEYYKEDPYTLSPDMQKVLDEDLDEIMNAIVKECDDPDLKTNLTRKEIHFINERMKQCIPDMRKVLKLIVTKRLLNIRTNLSFRVFAEPKLPKKTQLDEFLINYGVISLKKTVKGKMFIGQCDSYENFDKILSLTPVIGDNTVTFKPLQLAGPPEKSRKEKYKADRQKYIKKQIRTSDVNIQQASKQEDAVDEKNKVSEDNGSNKNKTEDREGTTKKEMEIKEKNENKSQIQKEIVKEEKEIIKMTEVTLTTETDFDKFNENDVDDWIDEEYDSDNILDEDLEDY